MSLKQLEIFRTDIGYTVVVDGMFADGLTPDEALGVVASAMFGTGKPIFVRTYEDTVRLKLNSYRFKTPVALLDNPKGGTQ